MPGFILSVEIVSQFSTLNQSNVRAIEIQLSLIAYIEFFFIVFPITLSQRNESREWKIRPCSFQTFAFAGNFRTVLQKNLPGR